jgi:hypothetical protein
MAEEFQALLGDLMSACEKLRSSKLENLSDEDRAVYKFAKSGANNLLWEIRYLSNCITDNKFQDAKNLADMNVRVTKMKKSVFGDDPQ